jgi:two-component system, OmpR family, response regulator
MLPNVDGFTIGKEIRLMDKNVPMIFLTAKALKEDILKGYNLGADDYITKPFDTEVLLCKISAIIKRQSTSPVTNESIFNIGTYRFDSKLRQIQRGDEIQKLSPKESDLLKLLCQNQNELLPRETALRKYGATTDISLPGAWMFLLPNCASFYLATPTLKLKIFMEAGFLWKPHPNLPHRGRGKKYNLIKKINVIFSYFISNLVQNLTNETTMNNIYSHKSTIIIFMGVTLNTFKN